jgi:hypothetical protein
MRCLLRPVEGFLQRRPKALAEIGFYSHGELFGELVEVLGEIEHLILDVIKAIVLLYRPT